MINYRITYFLILIGYVVFLTLLVDYVQVQGKGDILTYQSITENNVSLFGENGVESLPYTIILKLLFMDSMIYLDNLYKGNLFLLLAIAIFLSVFFSFLNNTNSSYLNILCLFVVLMHPRVFHLFVSNFRTGVSLALILPFLSYGASKIRLFGMSVVSILHAATVLLMLFVLAERFFRRWFGRRFIKSVLILGFFVLFSIFNKYGIIRGEPWNANLMYTASILIVFLVYIFSVVVFRGSNEGIFGFLSYVYMAACIACIMLDISGVRFFSIFLLISIFSLTTWSRDARLTYGAAVLGHTMFANYYYFFI